MAEQTAENILYDALMENEIAAVEKKLLRMFTSDVEDLKKKYKTEYEPLHNLARCIWYEAKKKK